jgi:hypothetical protein
MIDLGPLRVEAGSALIVAIRSEVELEAVARCRTCDLDHVRGLVGNLERRVRHVQTSEVHAEELADPSRRQWRQRRGSSHHAERRLAIASAWVLD